MKRLFGLLASILIATTAFAQEPQLGKDYILVDPPLPSQSSGKIEVVEFFSYGCPHCNDFNPMIKDWAAKQPADVAFRKSPVSFGRPAWERLSAIYFALEMTGDLAKLDAAVFAAIHGERINFSSNEKIIEWATSRGVDKTKFSNALNAFGMQSQIRRADMEAQAAKVTGVPAIVVGGRYLLNNSASGSYAELLKLVDTMVAKVRKESGKK